MHLLIVENQRLLRDLLVLACSGMDAFARTSTAGGAAEALAVMGRDPAEVIALSLRITRTDPIALARMIVQRHPRARLVALGDCNPSLPLCFPATDVFHGWVDTRTDAPIHLREALLHAARSRRYISPSILATRRRMGRDPVAPQRLLTDRELDLLPLLGQGLTNIQLAEQLNISPHTAQAHRRNIMRKLQLQTTPQLIYFVLSNGYANVPR